MPPDHGRPISTYERSRGSVSKRGTQILLDPKEVYDYLSGAGLAFKSLPQAMAMSGRSNAAGLHHRAPCQTTPSMSIMRRLP